MAASFSWKSLLFIISGINAKRLHSSPVQIIYHLVALITNRVLIMVPIKNRSIVKDRVIRVIETEKELNLFHIWFRTPISCRVVSN
jgi:hypothetical protein